MRIEQALYGEAHGGHALRSASGNHQVAKKIVQRLDLPDTSPSGVRWSPFLRGFPYLDRYVLSRTFLDTRASRGGMVFSHALIVPLDEFTRVSNMAPIVEHLAVNERSQPVAEGIDLVITDTRPPDADDLLNAAEALASSAGLPVVRVGHIGFDQLVVALWARLSPQMRQNFAFRLSFSPDDLVESSPPALICTPHATIGRWNGHQVIKSGNVHQPTSLASAVLSGQGNAAPLLEFMREIGTEPATFNELRLFDEACRLWGEKPTPERCIRAMKLVARLSPDSDIGSSLKNTLVQRLQTAMPKATAEHILPMRNLQLSAFRSPGRVWQTLEAWVAENIYPQDQDRHMLDALEDATSNSAVAEWRTAILDGLAASARSCKPDFRYAFWRWIQTRPDPVDAALNQVIVRSDVETRVAEVTPHRIAGDIAERLLALARSRGWLRLHGAVLSAVCSPLDAARQQITIDTGLSSMDGVRLSLRNAKPRDVLNCALEIGDPRTIMLAGEAAAQYLELLAQVDFRVMNAQAVWREAIIIDSDSWQGPADPMAAFHTVLDGLLDGVETDSSLIHRLSLTPVADLGRYPRRAELWLRLNGPILNNLIAATAKGWLTHACGGHVPFKPESALQSAILSSDEFETTLSKLIPDHLGTAARVAAALDSFGEERFKRLTNEALTRSTFLAVPDAEDVGRLIRDRNWKATASSLVEQYQSGRQYLEPALRVFHDMLGFWTRLFLGIKPSSESDKWKAFEELATELYPGGPSEDEVWERVGGKKGDLSLHENGRNQWRKVLQKVRHGKDLRPIAILKIMKEDFPNNERVSHLSDDPAFRKNSKDEGNISRSED